MAELLCRECCATRSRARSGIALTPRGAGGVRAEVLYRIGARRDPRGRRRSQILLNLADGPRGVAGGELAAARAVRCGVPVPAQQVPVRDRWAGSATGSTSPGKNRGRGRVRRPCGACGPGGTDAARDEDLRRRGWTLSANADDLAICPAAPRDPRRFGGEVRGVTAGGTKVQLGMCERRLAVFERGLAGHARASSSVCDAFLVAVLDVRAAGQVGVGGGLAGVVALQAVDDEADDEGDDEEFHGTKFALV